MGIDRKDLMVGISIMQNAAISNQLKNTQQQFGDVQILMEETERKRTIQVNLKKLAYEASKILGNIRESVQQDPLFAYIKLFVLRGSIDSFPNKLNELEEINDLQFADRLMEDIATLENNLYTNIAVSAESFLSLAHKYAQEQTKIKELENQRIKLQHFLEK